MKIIERSLNIVYELSKSDVELAITKFLGLAGDYRLEDLSIHEGNDESYAEVMFSQDMENR